MTAGPTDRMTVTLDSMRLYARHGVGAQEREVGNLFDVTVSVDIPPVYSDCLNDTVSYADIADLIREQMSIPSMLLEHVAARLRDALTEHFPQITGGSITVAKLTPPIPTIQLRSASVTLTW
ncbi:MAG: dihydroneopterin aldolase [Candidatus Amulumruptor sp.]|nr:dihydroneopterin aldolase [Paramuribaculum sp.]MDE7151834.1 dihydroneopterin aldolase [Candidatus Amulumruptor sp.]